VPELSRSPKRLRSHSKIDYMKSAWLAYFFSNAVPIKIAAQATQLTPKTVRAVYLDLRKRLLKPEFRRWHYTAGLESPVVSQSPDEIGPGMEFYDLLAECASNETCIRNYRLGNRKRRECRSCPLKKALTPIGMTKAFGMIDGTHMLYEAIGIRGEKGKPRGALLKERTIHMFVVTVAAANSKKLPNGLFAPLDQTFLSGGTLVTLLMASEDS